ARGEETVTVGVMPIDDHGKGRIGVQATGTPKKVQVSASEAAVLAITMPPQVVKELVIGIGKYIAGKAEGDLAGPAGIAKEAAHAAKAGTTELLYFLGALSAYLGAFNLIPFPALDGGRLLFLGYEATTRKRANARMEAHVHAVGLLMMLCLM